MKKPLLLVLFTLLLGGYGANAQDFTYKAKNPAFGGDTFNYQWLQSSATAQNDTKDPSAVNISRERDPLQQFQESLNQQILGQLAQKLVGNKFGNPNDPLRPGNYNVGNYQIGVTPSGGGFVLRITDTTTGGQTTITVPGL